MVAFTFISCDEPEALHVHKFSTEWKTDDTYHWHECTVDGCTEIKDKAEHSVEKAWIYDEKASTPTEIKLIRKCSICSKELKVQTLTEGFKLVANAEALESAVLEDNCKIILTADISLNDYLELAKDVEIYGNGHKLTIRCKEPDYGASGLYIKAPQKVVIRDLTIEAGSNYSVQTALIYKHYCDADVEIENVILNCNPNSTFENPAIGIQNTYDKKGKFTVKNCTITNAKYGMYFNALSDSVIDGNTIEGTLYNGIAIAGDNVDYPCKNVTISNNILKNVASKNYDAIMYNCGIYIGENTDNIITDGNDITLSEKSTNGKEIYRAEK